MEENRLSEDAVCKAVLELTSGLVHANLGGGVYKQRVARPGQGKSGGFRTIVFFKLGSHAFLIMGFAKKDRDNVTPSELEALKEFAQEVLGYDDKAIQQAIDRSAFEEVHFDDSLS
jgi:hypothetical protein